MNDVEPLRTGQVARVWPLAAVYGVLWLVLSVAPLSWTFGATDDWQPPAMPQPVIYGAIAAVFLLLAWRAFRIGVRVGDRGITIRNVTFSRRIAWEDIESFDLGLAPRFALDVTCLVRCADGTVRAVYALGQPVGIDRWTKRAVARLNATLEERRRTAAPASA